MAVEDALRVLAERVRAHSTSMLTEEAVKTAVILPFLNALGYDVFNPSEVVPEFIADAVGKKGEKVDYAVKVDGVIRMLVEAKPISTNLDKTHLAQLYRYFSVTSARFAILTNGRTFHFHTDLEEPNKLDDRPFLTFELSDLHAPLVAELKKFAKAEFSVENILKSAHQLKYTSAIKKEIQAQFESPSPDLVKLITANLQTGKFTADVREQFTPLVKNAYREIIRDSVQSRLSSALADTAEVETAPDTIISEDEVVTTDDEKEGFMIIRAIVREVMKPSRVFMRDQKSYCGVLIDDNNRRTLARMHFNRSVKYLSLFDGEKEEKVRIDSLDQIYDYSDRLRTTAKIYLDPKAKPSAAMAAAIEA